MNLEEISQLAQLCYQSNPTLVLGSGASIVHGIPSMDDLTEYLVNEVNPENDDEMNSWLDVQDSLNNGNHLEEHLKIKLSQNR